MLLEATLALAESSTFSTSIARTRRSQDRLAARLAEPARTARIELDWTDRPHFLAGVAAVARKQPLPDVLLAWLHDPLLMPDIVNLFDPEQLPLLFQVIGSASRDPLTIAREVRTKIGSGPRERYHQIILGYIAEPAGVRWLSDREICEGVMRSLESRRRELVVGETDSWRDHP